MSKLYFKYGAMNCGKTTALIQCAHNYEERGMSVVILKPAVDTRDADTHTIRSRVASPHHCVPLGENDNPKHALIVGELGNHRRARAVLVDEAQFLSAWQVKVLAEIADAGTPVMCYGLRTDSNGMLFPGSQRLLAIADKLEEIKTICHCGKKATMVLRIDSDGIPVSGGSQICVGGNESYVSVCRAHFYKRQPGVN